MLCWLPLALSSVGDPLWNQLAALPILALQSNREQPGAVVAAIADGITESVEKSLFLHMTDEAVSAICSNQTGELAARLSSALERAEEESTGLLLQQQQQEAVVTLAPKAALTPPMDELASASSHLELESAPAFGAMASRAAAATGDAIEHVWRMLPELLMQSIDTQALEALNGMHTTSLQLAEATLAISDDLAHHRVPALAAVRQHGAALMQQVLLVSGAWVPGAPAMVSTIVQDQIMAPLNQSTAEASRRFKELTGEEVGASFEVLLERSPGNKVDALQTLLRAVLKLYKNGLLQLVADAKAVVAPWHHNLTAASLAVVDGMRDSSLHSIKLIEESIDAPALQEAMKYYIEPKTAQALIKGVHRALQPLQADCNRFAASMSAAIADAIEGALASVLDELRASAPAAEAGATAAAERAEGEGDKQVLDKIGTVARQAFAALHTALSKPANSTADLAEVHDNLVRGARATAERISSAARQRLRVSVRTLKRTYARGIRGMARTLTSELIMGMRAALIESGSCERVGPPAAGGAAASLFA